MSISHPKPKADILVVDDTPDNLRLLQKMLNSRYRVRLAPDGKTALMAVHSTPPDLILLDVMMSDMNGYEVAEQLKADSTTADIPIIFISALDDIDSKVRAFAVGGVDYVTKPFQEREVIARLETHLSLRELQRALRSLNTELARQNDLLRERMVQIEALQTMLSEQAVRDPLTGVFNRRYLEETLVRELARAEREATPLSVAMMDVDHFKQFNDAYGHQAGDLLLQEFTQLVQGQIRKGDALCRYGGEEFVVLMPNAWLEDAHRRAEQWRQACENLTLNYKGRLVGATVSLGVATNCEPGLNSDRLLNMADQALYLAKAAGRNCTISWQTT